MQPGGLAERLHHRRPDGEIGHKMAVHHVHVEHVGSRRVSSAAICSPRRAKSAERMDGRISTMRHYTRASYNCMLSRRRKSHPRGRGREAGDGLDDHARRPANNFFILFRFQRAGGIDQAAARASGAASACSSILRWQSGEIGEVGRARSRHLISGLRARVPVPEQGASTRMRSNLA